MDLWFFLTCQVDGSPANLVREWPKHNVPDQKPGKEQRSSQTDLIGLMLDEKPLSNTDTGTNTVFLSFVCVFKVQRCRWAHKLDLWAWLGTSKDAYELTSVTMESMSSVKVTCWRSSCWLSEVPSCCSIRYSGVYPTRTISMDWQAMYTWNTRNTITATCTYQHTVQISLWILSTTFLLENLVFVFCNLRLKHFKHQVKVLKNALCDFSQFVNSCHIKKHFYSRFISIENEERFQEN